MALRQGGISHVRTKYHDQSVMIIPAGIVVARGTEVDELGNVAGDLGQRARFQIPDSFLYQTFLALREFKRNHATQPSEVRNVPHPPGYCLPSRTVVRRASRRF